MLINYFKIAWRNLRKNKAFSLINIIGLSAGLMCFTIILIYVDNELSFDNFHKDANRIYRVVKDFINTDGSKIPDATTPPALAGVLRKELPEVDHATRLFPSWGRKYLIQHGEKSFYETNLIRIDSSFFDVFDFEFVRADKTNPFKGKQSIVVTQTTAKKYFGNTDPLGKILRINVNNGQDFVVTGVLKDVPQNAHFTFDFLIPFVSAGGADINNDWNWNSFYTYVLLKPTVDPNTFKSKLQPLFKKYQPESKNQYYAQLLTDIHLKSNLKWELGVNGDLAYVKILTLIAAFVIIIAGINYVNLITAQSFTRAKEVGIRKVAGASRQLLVLQFLLDSVCTAFVSFGISLVAVSLLLPLVNRELDRNLAFFCTAQWLLWIELVGVTLFIGLLAGLYPAFQLSSFQPTRVLKGKFISSYHGASLRKSLVVFQFVISIVLLVSFVTIYRQLEFVTKKNLGFNKNNILLLPNVRGGNDPGPMVEELKRIPAVTNLARADGILGRLFSTNGVSSQNQNNHISLNFMRIDHEFLNTLEIDLEEGRNFLSRSVADSTSIILNQKAVEELGLKRPWLGQQLRWDDETNKTHLVHIIGIAKDFHFTSLHEPIKPFAFVSEENNGSTFFLKLQSQHLAKDITLIQQVWTRHNPDKPFEYSFQDEEIAQLYLFDIKFKNLFSGVTLLAVLIACLGLLGLSIYAAAARTKEIGIRKVLGAGIVSLFALLSKDFLLLIGIAIIGASPIAWWAMHRWLQNFAYRVDLSWWMFAIAGLAAIFIALITVSFQAVKSVLANPVKSLRTE
jgi:putative ABC transport system permease protein